jgi:hypothetical protein
MGRIALNKRLHDEYHNNFLIGVSRSHPILIEGSTADEMPDLITVTEPLAAEMMELEQTVQLRFQINSARDREGQREPGAAGYSRMGVADEWQRSPWPQGNKSHPALVG